jgi:hypothetical protein
VGGLRAPPRTALGYAYHSQLIGALLNRFGGVPLLDLYFRYLWPAYLTIAAATLFVTVRRLASSGVALLAVVLLLFGSDLSYIAAELRPPYAEWDRMIWSNKWLTPGAEQLFFNPWTPALAVLLLGTWTFDRYSVDGHLRWLIASASCIAALVQFKPFAYAVVMGRLVLAAFLGRVDRTTQRRTVLLSLVSVALSLPYVYAVRRTVSSDLPDLSRDAVSVVDLRRVRGSALDPQHALAASAVAPRCDNVDVEAVTRMELTITCVDVDGYGDGELTVVGVALSHAAMAATTSRHPITRE